MLEFIIGAFRSLFSFERWVSGGHVLDTLAEEQSERKHNRQWAQEFLNEKRLERQQQVLKREARASKSVNQPQLGRPGSRRTP